MEMSINRGNSGGPLLDERGNVIGIVSSGLVASRAESVPDGIAFAVKADFVWPLAGSARVAGELEAATGEEPDRTLEELVETWRESVVRIEAEH